MPEETGITFVDTAEIVLIDCPRCGQHKQAHHIDKHICVDCAHAENTRITYYRQHQSDWVAAAKEASIDVWLQQPGETQWEYTVWCAYRDSYPGKKPSYASVAQQLNTTANAVKKIAQRWSFQLRMQAWMSECDRITMAQRRQEILDMNAEHVSMAAKLRRKMNTAIDAIEPTMLKPGEIATLAKLATELERKARIDTISQEEMRRDLFVDNDNPEIKKSPTKQSDLGEVVNILAKAGVLGNITQIGVRETTTTTREVVAKDDTGATAEIIQEE